MKSHRKLPEESQIYSGCSVCQLRPLPFSRRARYRNSCNPQNKYPLIIWKIVSGLLDTFPLATREIRVLDLDENCLQIYCVHENSICSEYY
ncbi:hypothetical protein OUZ56_025542 [Daphnia magna]|uniref:Uncharacterized protein n=1 Tax=Daphnia magna TaxID=35525 RepID=A0ABQ9ZK58_9CRUS|nr:hypothetical protein OUZ56_025542 [Daphnia magna]